MFCFRHRVTPVVCLALAALCGCGSGGVATQVQAPVTATGASAKSSALVALGDSITHGYTLGSPGEQAYPVLVSNALGKSLSNVARNGDQACDVFPQQIYPAAVGYTTPSTPVSYSLLIGTNDVDVQGIGAYEPIFNTCQQAVLSWVGTLPADKVLPGDADITTTGGCSNKADTGYLGGIACGASGSITATLVTTGNAIYLWYYIADISPVSSTFTVALDGVAFGTASTVPAASIHTQNGTTLSVALLRIPAKAGQHTVTVQTPGGIAIQGFGTNRSVKPIPVAVGDLPNQLQGNPFASIAAQLQYSADIQANFTLLLNDGLDLRFAADRTTMLGTSAEMNDSLHPNVLGHQHLAAAFQPALQ